MELNVIQQLKLTQIQFHGVVPDTGAQHKLLEELKNAGGTGMVRRCGE